VQPLLIDVLTQLFDVQPFLLSDQPLVLAIFTFSCLLSSLFLLAFHRVHVGLYKGQERQHIVSKKLDNKKESFDIKQE
jgi:hypothetical protein